MVTTEEPQEQQTEEPEAPVIAEFDMDNLPTVNHRWVDRGIVMSCENAGHPNHRHYKRQVRK